MKSFSLILFSLLSFATFAQNTVTVKKGKINANKETIATYDGNGGAFRMGQCTITLPGDTTSLIRFNEVHLYFQNPLLEEYHYLYEIRFATHPEQVFYIRPEPYRGKLFGQEVVNYKRKFGNDLVELIFNDDLPLIIADKKLDKAKVDEMLAKLSIRYDFDAVKASAKALEDSISTYAGNEIARDKTKPVSFQMLANISSSNEKWFTIVQDGQVIGKLFKGDILPTPQAMYQVWKKAPAGATLQGKPVDFVPVVTMPLTRFNAAKAYQATQVSGKAKIDFSTPNQMEAESDLLKALIAKGIL